MVHVTIDSISFTRTSDQSSQTQTRNVTTVHANDKHVTKCHCPNAVDMMITSRKKGTKTEIKIADFELAKPFIRKKKRTTK